MAMPYCTTNSTASSAIATKSRMQWSSQNITSRTRAKKFLPAHLLWLIPARYLGDNDNISMIGWSYSGVFLMKTCLLSSGVNTRMSLDRAGLPSHWAGELSWSPRKGGGLGPSKILEFFGTHHVTSQNESRWPWFCAMRNPSSRFNFWAL